MRGLYDRNRIKHEEEETYVLYIVCTDGCLYAIKEGLNDTFDKRST